MASLEEKIINIGGKQWNLSIYVVPDIKCCNDFGPKDGIILVACEING